MLNTARNRYQTDSYAVVSLIITAVYAELDCYDTFRKILFVHLILHVGSSFPWHSKALHLRYILIWDCAKLHREFQRWCPKTLGTCYNWWQRQQTKRPRKHQLLSHVLKMNNVLCLVKIRCKKRKIKNSNVLKVKIATTTKKIKDNIEVLQKSRKRDETSLKFLIRIRYSLINSPSPDAK